MKVICHNNKSYQDFNTKSFNGFMTVRSNLESVQDFASTIEEQTSLVMEDLLKTLNSFGTCLEKLLSTTIYLHDLKELDAFKSVWENWFNEQQKPQPKHFVIESPNQIHGLKLEIVSTVAF